MENVLNRNVNLSYSRHIMQFAFTLASWGKTVRVIWKMAQDMLHQLIPDPLLSDILLCWPWRWRWKPVLLGQVLLRPLSQTQGAGVGARSRVELVVVVVGPVAGGIGRWPGLGLLWGAAAAIYFGYYHGEDGKKKYTDEEHLPHDFSALFVLMAIGIRSGSLSSVFLKCLL